ncbi:hypothetical protein OBK28_05685 [Empedobacter falsenii]|uniref:Carboxypeptidase-like regulatory domain-containing protein n=1 Tax=Empedobacter falsenii TaxID=343874 RepID=A0ABY8V7U0_9FLAO|nr:MULTISPECIES: hypothetical protein [Empedobacter]WIH97656.1 hypothetical protein OBA43_01590 [Empedobacter falsenii]HJD87532.1 hypothetical protein [Empedobacter falsenii]
MKSLFTILILLFSQFIFAQEKWIQGNIIIDDSDDTAEGIYVTNLRTNHTTISNFTGTFLIQAQVNDTLKIQSDWYENRLIILKPNLFSKPTIVVHLAVQTIQLNTAFIGQKLTGILEKDVKNGKKQDVVTNLYKSLGVNPDIKPIKDTSALRAGLLDGDISLTRLDIGRLYDVFTGKAKQRKALIDYESKYDKITKIKNYFGEDYFINDLKIPKFKIRDFIDNALTNTESKIELNDVNYFKLLQLFNSYSKIYLDFLYGKVPNNTKVIQKDTIDD